MAKKDTKISQEKIEEFLKGEITLAEMQGISQVQAYLMADMGYNCYKQGKLDQAEMIFNGLAALNHKDFYFHSVLGMIYAAKDEHKKAIDSLNTALELNEADISSFAARAEAFLKIGEFQKALKDMSVVLENKDKENIDLQHRVSVLAESVSEIIKKTIKDKK